MSYLLLSAPNCFPRSFDEPHQYVADRPRLDFGALTDPFGSILPLYQLLRSEGSSPHQRPNDIRLSAETDIPDQAPIRFVLLCSRVASQRYVRSPCTSTVYWEPEPVKQGWNPFTRISSSVGTGGNCSLQGCSPTGQNTSYTWVSLNNYTAVSLTHPVLIGYRIAERQCSILGYTEC